MFTSIMVVLIFLHLVIGSASSSTGFNIVDSNGRKEDVGIIGLLLYKGGTVCDDNFDNNAADSICREMGYSRSSSWKSGSDFSFGESQTNLDITLDDVTCRDNDWKSCSYSTSHNCGHSEDVFLSCQAGFIVIDSQGEKIDSGKIGLLLYEGGTVCDDFFDNNVANAICREMGHSRSTSWKSGIDPLFGENQTSLDITLDDIKCSDNDWKSCSYSTLHNCEHNEDVFLSCQAVFSLVDLSGDKVYARSMGLLLYDEGTVCDDFFDDNAADSICREMGYYKSTWWMSGIDPLFGENQTNLDITLDDVTCSDNDWKSCSYSTSHNCGHSEDVFLSCQAVFRLIDSDGEDVDAGMLGVLLYQGGTVCNDYFDNIAANAICREMGHSMSTSWKSGINLLFGKNRTSLNITLDDVKCIDNKWTSCSYSISNIDCDHSEDVLMSCQADFSIVDTNSEKINPGFLGLLLYEGGTVCDDSFNDNAANAICREMGYYKYTWWISGSDFSFGESQTNLDITLDDVTCSDNDWKSCSYSTSHNCGHSEDVFLSCQAVFSIISSLGDESVDGEMGLLLYKGGTVCNDNFNDNAANAICREMGHSRSTSWKSGIDPLFGENQTSLDITLDDIKCSDNDWKSCSYSTLHDCRHSEDVFLSCRIDKMRILPTSVSQSSTWESATANLAVDGRMATNSNTQCGYNRVIWFRMVFDAVYCFSEVLIFQSHMDNLNAPRMDGTTVIVENSETESRDICGRLVIMHDFTVKGQTYNIPCDSLCGNSILLEANHGSGSAREGCIHMKEIEAYYSAVDGGYSDFGDWSECSADCGGGTQTRTRTCTNPTPAHGGDDCAGWSYETRECNTPACPVDGGYSDFGEWSECTALCGGGTQTRSRTCSNPAPAHGGADCQGFHSEIRNCNSMSCSESCKLVKKRGYLKMECTNSIDGEIYYQCHNSSGWYSAMSISGKKGKSGEDVITREFERKCENDENSYQACGMEYSQKVVKSFENALCQVKISLINGRVSTELIEEKHSPKGGKVALRSGLIIDKNTICNDVCETDDCEDEASCNNLTYGQYCHINDNATEPIKYIIPEHICSSLYHEESCCKNPSKDRSYVCNAISMCNPKTVENPTVCRRYIFDKLGGSRPLFGRYILLNITRCFPRIQCHGHIDQTNCTDPQRVGATCNIKGYTSTVSKYVVCKSAPGVTYNKMCDDGLDQVCEQISHSCRVHKHQLCDGSPDCKNMVDENLSICQSKTILPCLRRAGNGTFSQTFPTAWLNDGFVDCMNGEDEKIGIWPTCGVGESKRYATENSSCTNVFLCRTKTLKFVELKDLCDGIDTCGNENRVCKASRNTVTVMNEVPTNVGKAGVKKSFSYCLKGLEHLRKLTHECTSEKFIFPDDDIYGVSKTTISLPNMKTNCDNLFGEYYLYSSCTDKCIKSFCPLTSALRHDSCPEFYTDRVKTIANNQYLTFAVKGRKPGHYTNNIFSCVNGIKCIPYHRVCDLVDDCGDGSDEQHCTNNFRCGNSGHFIPRTSKCDGKVDCLDHSDECNDECSREILNGSLLKGFSWAIGVGAVSANLITLTFSFWMMKKCRTSVALTNKSLVALVSAGDLLVGCYLLTLSFYDEVGPKENYCSTQFLWLTSNQCITFGVTSTIGSQLSLFAMTILSLVRAHGILNSMRIPGEVNIKKVIGVILIDVSILASSVIVAVLPLLKTFEDFFINGLYYDAGLKLFIGLVDKKTHFRVFREYFGRLSGRVLSWDQTDAIVAEMFSHDFEYEDYTTSRRKVGFYGNDGVCLFKYFIQEKDPQQVFVWIVLVFNFLCFLVISACYIIIGTLSVKSSRTVSSNGNNHALQRARRMNRKISIIIATDFLCWIPFIVACMLHYLAVLDATSWYSFFSVIILPINSVINPLLYSDFIMARVLKATSHSKRITMGWLSRVTSQTTLKVGPVKVETDAEKEIIEMEKK